MAADPLRFRRGTPLVLQAAAAECGLACLTMVAAAFGREVDIRALRRLAGQTAAGTS